MDNLKNIIQRLEQATKKLEAKRPPKVAHGPLAEERPDPAAERPARQLAAWEGQASKPSAEDRIPPAMPDRADQAADPPLAAPIGAIAEGREKEAEEDSLSAREMLLEMFMGRRILLLNISASLSMPWHGKVILSSLALDHGMGCHLNADFSLTRLAKGEHRGWTNYLWHYAPGICQSPFFRRFILSREAYFSKAPEGYREAMDPDFQSENRHQILLCPYGSQMGLGDEGTFLLDAEKSLLRICLMSPEKDADGKNRCWLAEIICGNGDGERLYSRLSGSAWELFGFFHDTVPGFADIEGDDAGPFLALGPLEAHRLETI